MPKTRDVKDTLIAEYKALVEKSTAMVFTNFRSTSVKQQRSLRAKLKESGVEYLVVKNTLFGIALKSARNVDAESLLNGPNGIAFIGEDISKGVTALKDWIRDAKALEITGALLESTVLNAKDAEKLSELPTKDQMRAQLLGVISAPASSLVRIINAPSSSLARVINAHAEKQQEAA